MHGYSDIDSDVSECRFKPNVVLQQMNTGTLGEDSEINEVSDTDSDTDSEQSLDCKNDAGDEIWTPSISGEDPSDQLDDQNILSSHGVPMHDQDFKFFFN